MNNSEKLTPLESLARLCSSMRRNGEAPRVLILTDNAPKLVTAETDKSGLARVLASRGGAFRDVHQPQEAIKMGKASISLNPAPFHAYRLLGAAYYDLGLYDQGDRYFQEAIKRGANAKDIQRVVDAIKNAHAKEMKVIARFADEEADEREYFDLDDLREAGLIRNELDDISEGFHRSEDSGWYYES